MSNELYTGFAKQVMTPPMGMQIPGYYNIRLADGVISDLYVEAIALSCGDTKAIIFTADALSIYAGGYNIIKQKVSERCGISEDAVFINCCHTHTGTRIVAPLPGHTETENVYWSMLFQQFADTAQFAFEDLKPTKVKVATGEAKNIAFMRRYRMKDGSCCTNPATGDPNIASFNGVQDESVQLVRLIREGGKEVLLVNFGTHADVIGGTKYCADWPGFTRDVLCGALEGNAEVMILVGCQGDSAHANRFLPKGTNMKGVPIAKRMARVLGGEVLKIYDDAKEIEHDKITFSNRIVTVLPNPYDPEDVPEALEIQELYNKIPNGSDPAFKKFRLSVPKALRIAGQINGPKSFNIQVSSIQLGKLAFIGLGGEPFVEIGTKIKEASKMDMTICTCNTNGSQGYFPTAQAFAENGYESSHSQFEHGVAQKLIDAALELIDEME